MKVFYQAPSQGHDRFARLLRAAGDAVKVIQRPLHRAKSVCTTCTSRRSCRKGIPTPIHRARSHCSPLTSRRSYSDGILPPVHMATSLCSTCTSRRSCDDGIPSPLPRAKSLFSTCTSRGSRGEGIPSPLHRAKKVYAVEKESSEVAATEPTVHSTARPTGLRPPDTVAASYGPQELR